MSKKSAIVTVGVVAFLAGTVLPSLIFWNPGGWAWIETLKGTGATQSEGASQEGKQLWTCGMHPQVIQDEPGNCPICGMRLVPVKDSTSAGGEMTSHEGHDMTQAQQTSSGAEPRGERKVLYWRAPMDPNYISDKPGKSPMGMDLIPVYEDEPGAEPGAGGIRVDPSFLQNFAVRTAVVERGSIPLDIRTVGILDHNQANVVSVNTKFDGWIEKSYFNNVGEYVKRGDLLFEIYSPQLVTTQQEFLTAVDYVRRMSESSYPDATERAKTLLESARERLRYWDISDEQIEQLRMDGKAQRALKFFSPASGFIVAKGSDSLEGMRLMPGMTVLKLADHSKLWAEVQLYEDQLRHVRMGTPVRVEVDSFPGRRWAGKVVFFDSAVDPMTRTLKAYVEVDNRDLKLLPKMYATITVLSPAVSGAVKVPSQAIIHSGERSVVIVQTRRGVFQPREVELGPAGGGEQEIRRGLQPGEVIVTSSQFLIDSESNLKAAIQQMLGERSQSEIPEPAEKQSPTVHQH